MTNQEYIELEARLNLVEIRKKLSELDIEALSNLIPITEYKKTLRFVSDWANKMVLVTNERLQEEQKELPLIEEIQEKHNMNQSTGPSSHPDECYQYGLQDMYEAIKKELND